MTSFPYMRIIVPIIGIAAIAALLSYTYLATEQAKHVFPNNATISVTGTGEVTAIPDVATFTFSVHAEGTDATVAQDESAKSINAINEYLKQNGIEDKDIKTQYYNLNPRYEYTQSICTDRGYCPPGEQILRGYEVTQSILIKVRDTSKAGELISGVGTRGATDISGLTFTVDDEDALKAEAREKAIADAREQANKLAQDLGVHMVRISGFWEDNGGYPSPMMYQEKAMSADSAAGNASVAPSLPSGENTVTSHVTITYDVR